MRPKNILQKIGAGIVAIGTAGVAFTVPWITLPLNPVFFGVSVRTATSAFCCAAVAILSWAVLNRGSGPGAGGGNSPPRLSKPHARGRYIHQACGAFFDEPAICEDFREKKKLYVCPGCGAPLGELSAAAPEPPKAEAPPVEAPKPAPTPAPLEQPVLLEIVVKGPASARVVPEAKGS